MSIAELTSMTWQCAGMEPLWSGYLMWVGTCSTMIAFLAGSLLGWRAGRGW